MAFPYPLSIGRIATMKTTIEIHDELLARAKQHAKATGRSLRAVIEDGLRQVLVPSLIRGESTVCPI